MVGVPAGPGSRLRLYLAGPICVEWDGRVLDERDLPSRQVRILLAFLACQRARPSSCDVLADLLWPDVVPPSWETSLKVLVSKLRRGLGALAPARAAPPSIHARYGCYQLDLPADAWVDLDAARTALDEAEGALRRSRPEAAWGAANVAVAVGRRGFLPGESSTWAEEQRRDLERLLVRALDVYAATAVAIGQPALAVEASLEALRVDPLREPSWRGLMVAHDALGNRPEALSSFHRLRVRLREELGVSPSPETQAVFGRILRGPGSSLRSAVPDPGPPGAEPDPRPAALTRSVGRGRPARG
jgi:DNA-binding SARP family transcriptional activator